MTLAVEPSVLPRRNGAVAGEQNATILARSSPMAGATELVVSSPGAAAVKSGEFFQIAVGAPGTLLRRPYSAAWADPSSDRIGFIFNIVGKGSEWLAAREPGEQLDLLGPLGRGFNLGGSGRAICVAGGLGIAVFPGLVRALLTRGRRVTMLIGARSAAHLMSGQRFPGADVQVATDDGTAGHHGSVVDLLVEVPQAEIFACGPTPMLQAMLGRTERLGLPRSSIQVALETPMGCGIGTCLGCAAPRSGGGFLLACQDGPCVSADRLDWNLMSDAFHD